ncbi:MAG: DUF6314 family protein [Pseudomonadota bacterium]
MLKPSDFIRTWRLDRQLADRRGEMNGNYSGQANWTMRQDGGVDYAEAGTLMLARGGQMRAERQYLWRWETAGVAVFFADGAFFHRFVPTGKTEGTTHLCGDDIYNVAYDFSQWPNWSATWDVSGPRKAYTAHSSYWPV